MMFAMHRHGVVLRCFRLAMVASAVTIRLTILHSVLRGDRAL